MRRIRHRADDVFVTFAQLDHQILKVGRQMRGVRAKVPLQPLAHRIADRSAGLAINRFAVFVDWIYHREFPCNCASRRSSHGGGKCFSRRQIARSFGEIPFKKAMDGSMAPLEADKRPRPDWTGAFLMSGSDDFGSIATIDQAPAGSPRGRNQPQYIAAAVSISAVIPIIGRPTDEEAWTTPTPAAAVPPTMPAAAPTMAAPGRGRCRCQCGHAQRSRGNCNKREFA